MNGNTKKLVSMAVLVAIVMLLQLLSSFIRLGSFPITLVLVPIVIGAALYGSGAGAALGGAFGVVVLINCINGVDVGGNMLWVSNPALTAALCIVKGVAAGFAAGVMFAALSKMNIYIASVAAAVICPVVNTGIFIVAMFLFYRDILSAWAGETEIIYFALIGLAGLNFLLELGVNSVLSPVIVRIIKVLRKDAVFNNA